MRKADRAYLKETFGDDYENEVASPSRINDREQEVLNKHRDPLKPDLFRNANQEVHFDRHKVKMSSIPIEFLYNDKMNFLKAIDLNKPNVTIATHIQTDKTIIDKEPQTLVTYTAQIDGVELKMDKILFLKENENL